MKPKIQIARCFAAASAFALSVSAHGAALTWDTVPGDAASITAGGGTWDTSTIIWNNAGADVAWSQTSATVPTNSATFAGSDGSEDAYAISVATAIATQALTFNNTGYSLSASPARIITHTGQTISVATGKSATIGAGVTASFSTTSGASNIAGGGTLVVTGAGASVSKPSNLLNIIGGTTVRVEDSGLFTTSSQILVGTNSGSGTLVVDGGTASSTTGTTNHNLILANASGTNTVSGTLTIESGTVTHPAVSGGLRFGSTTSLTSPNTATGIVNLNGGQFTIARIYEGSADPGILSTFNFNGGTLIVRSGATNAANFMTGLDAANVLSGGAKIDTNGVNTTIAQALLDGGGDGGLTKEGNGILTLTGANTYTGDTIINGGKIAITAPYSDLTDTTVNANARLRVSTGASASSIPSVTMEDGSGLEVDIGTYDPGLLSSINTPTFNANGNYVIDLTGVDIEPGTITVLTYGAKTGSGMPSVGNVPPGLPVSVTDTGSAIVLTIDPYVIWSAGTGDWDTVTSNWTGNTYTEGDAAVFPDLAGNNAVTLTADRSPSEVGITIQSPNTYTFTGSAITGAAGVVKTGSGIATFENANSYAGPLAIQGGAVVKTVADTTTGDIAAANNASLALSGGITTGSGQTFTFTGPGLNAANLLFTGSAIQRGAIQSADGNNTWAGDISFSGSANNRLGVQDGTTLNLSGNITESAPGSSLAFRHGNTAGSDIIISGTTNNWTGTTDIFGGGGALKLGANNALPTASVIRVGTSSITGDSTFDLNGFNQTCAGLTQVAADTSFVTNSGSADSILTILSLSDQSFGGVIQDGATHKTSLVKDGTFSQTLTAASTYTGATTIDGGTLALGSAGSIASSATVAIDEDATLDASAKTTFVLEAAQPLTLRIDAGTSGKIKAAELDIQNAQVTLDVIASGEPVYILAEYTSLVGIAFASVNSVPGYEIDYAYNLGTQIALVQDAPAGFASWITGNFSNGTVPGGQQGATDDPDQDGLENLIEFVLNGDPTASDPGILPVLDASGANFVFSFTRRADSAAGTTQVFEYGSTLAAWTPLAITGTPASEVALGPVVGDTQSVTVTIPKSLESDGKLFGRLKVTQP